MGRKKRKKKFTVRELFDDLTPEAVRGIWVVALLLLAISAVLAAAGYGGVVGDSAYQFLFSLLGVGYFLLPALFLTLVAALLKSGEEDRAAGTSKWVGAFLFFISGLGLMHLVFEEQGGLVGTALSTPLIALFDPLLSVLILTAVLVISLLLIFNTALPTVSISGVALRTLWTKLGRGQPHAPEQVEHIQPYEHDGENEGGSPENADDIPKETEEEDAGETRRDLFSFARDGRERTPTTQRIYAGDYTPPPLSLLEKDRGKPSTGDVKANANLIKRTLQNFGIHVEIDEISIGPSVTRYAAKPAEGVRLSRIVSLGSNLELALAAHPVRIEAPIPGRSLVGIEVPNTAKATVGLATLLGKEEFQKSSKSLAVTLGKDITGQAHYADLGKMPHLLIAGATGAGKSVTIHALITSLLYRNSPQALRFIMIDPKRVELTLYNNIPHLLTPVITDAKKTILALKWAAKEMERRYDILEAEAVRDIVSYHESVVTPARAKLQQHRAQDTDDLPEAMPYVVIVIDELADIMQAYPRELESAVVRLAQMSRAVGIHLVLSTQRPSVNVITGLIKANVPARIALQVSSQIDSRTILDAGGAEKLLGAGDMLYLSGDMSKPKRLQSAFISEKEVKKVAAFLKEHAPEHAEEELTFAGDENGTDVLAGNLEESSEDDELYGEARELVIKTGKASTSYLQRKLRVGYARAARLVDMLEEHGVIGPPDGARPREVLVKDAEETHRAENEEE